MNSTPEESQGRGVSVPPPPAPSAPSGEEDKPAPIPCWKKLLIGGYLIAMLLLMVALMLWVWSVIPLPSSDKQPAGSMPAAPSAATPQGGDVTAPNSAEPSHFSRVLTRLFREDARYLLLVLVMGALGGTLYGLLGFCLHLAMEDFKPSWNCWYVCRPFLGAGLALLVFLAIRGGFLTLSNDMTSLSLYSTAAIAGLCGMFSEQASKKLAEIFGTLFRTKDDHVRSRAEDRKVLMKEMAEAARFYKGSGPQPGDSDPQ